ncbi:hypothetical protein E2C01_101587 [Portunus trituberculatus]|uniref:Uncharacterized protein n=1 Tax=Portunus trituberculatus TaxID=210409 RepID=A0A5B7KKS3_PORTR|nr:hypothetical protein [Portunus trituberculatus]
MGAREEEEEEKEEEENVQDGENRSSVGSWAATTCRYSPRWAGTPRGNESVAASRRALMKTCSGRGVCVGLKLGTAGNSPSAGQFYQELYFSSGSIPDG